VNGTAGRTARLTGDANWITIQALIVDGGVSGDDGPDLPDFQPASGPPGQPPP
jgi:hypothetical protein